MLIVKLICLVLGTALTALFILFALRGRKEDWRIEGVPQKEFSDKELWAAGFAMQQLPVFSMDSAVGKKMMSASAILHPENGGRFVEYWARLYWARTLSMSLLVLALAFCASVFMDGYMVFVVLIAGVAMVAVTYSNGANEMSNQLKKRSEECMMEFSNVVSKLTLLMNCGMILKEAWYIVAKSKKGVIYDLMQEACREMDNGTASAEAIYNFGVRTGSPEVRKFASIIIQNMSQLKALFKDSWESLVGNCDEFLYLGGNEKETHKYVSELLGKETIDTNTYGQTKGKSGSYSTNFQQSGRELLQPDEVRMLDNQNALLFIRGERPILDAKYDLMKHPNIRYTEDGGAGPFNYAKAPLAHDDFTFDETRYDDYELLLDEDIIGELF